ncbi:MAG: CaiB/BaiF CoA-transferase family protein [Conexivisphaerales archaeon]
MADEALLKGVKVVDLTRALAGPFCTMMLADLGAEVVKVEPPPSGDEARLWGPPFLGGESTYFMSVNRNKRSIVLDLRNDVGKEVARRLLSLADVVVENFRPGTTKKLGIDYDTVKSYNPKVIYCSISGFGQTGPYRELPGYDIIAFAMSGMMSITGEAGRPPVKMGVPVADIGAGMFAAYAIASALFRRERTGIGEYIDVSLLEGQIFWLTYQAGYYFATLKDPERLGSAHLSIAPYQAFRARDGYFIIAAGNDEHWRRLCDVLELNSLKEDTRFKSNPDRVKNRTELEKILSSVFVKDSARNWVEKISKAGVPCCVINSISDVFADEHVKARQVVMEIEHKKAGRIKQLNIPYRFNNYTFKISKAPPTLGEDTEEILKELGYSKAEIESMKKSLAIY